MPHRFTTIKDIARQLNISVSTVSRALRDTHDVNPETRQKVLQMAAALHYKPNFNATGLANRQTHNIGVVLPFIANYYFSTVITGIQEMAYSKGYRIILYLTNDLPDAELSVINDMAMSGLDGLLVAVSSGSCNSSHFQAIMDNGIPVVFFDRVAPDIRTSKVMQDDFNGAFEAVSHLVTAGYRKIAHIGGPRGMELTERRRQGYIAALEKHQLPVREDWMIHSGFSQENGEADTGLLLDGGECPDAVFAISDRKAIGAMLTLKKRNISIGKEMGVMGFTNDPVAALVTPSLTTIAEPAFEIGRKSCELLLRHLTKKNFIPEEIMMPGRLIVRESTRQ